MTQVNLEILRGPYRPALAKRIELESFRLLVDISVHGGRNWGPFLPGIVDTGAPLSLLPRRLWEPADIQLIERLRIGGLTPRPECMLDVTMARVVFTIRDQISEIGPIQADALLADSNDVPTLIGMRGILAELTLHMDVQDEIAYLQSRD